MLLSPPACYLGVCAWAAAVAMPGQFTNKGLDDPITVLVQVSVKYSLFGSGDLLCLSTQVLPDWCYDPVVGILIRSYEGCVSIRWGVLN